MSAQTIVDGLLLGGLYAAIGIGFSLVWGVLNVVNVAHGALIVVGAYVTWVLFNYLHVDPFLSMPAAMLVLFVVGFITQHLTINRVMAAGIFMSLTLTFGLQQIITNVMLIIFKADYRAVVPSYSGAAVVLGSIRIPVVRLGVLVAAIVLAVLLYAFMRFTKIGRAIVATALNRYAAELMGVDVHRTWAITFGVGGALAGAAGALLTMEQTLTPDIAGSLTGVAFIVVVLGGLGNIVGTLLGGLLLGVAEIVGASVLGPSYQTAIGFAILVAVLLFKPTGLFGRPFFAETTN